MTVSLHPARGACESTTNLADIMGSLMPLEIGGEQTEQSIKRITRSVMRLSMGKWSVNLARYVGKGGMSTHTMTITQGHLTFVGCALHTISSGTKRMEKD